MAVSLLTGALIATGAGSAIANFFGNRAQGKASEKAAAQLQEGVREARAYAEPKYAEAQTRAHDYAERSQALLSPYAQQGGQGLTALTALLGLPAAPAGVAAPAPQAAAPAGVAPSPSGVGTTTLANGIPLSLINSLTTKQLADANRALGGGLLGMAGTQGTAAPATQSSYVSLRAPTGDVRPVPADQVDFYLARGATRI